ncbi:unnamed protein product [Lactuca saligna]|uniref:Carbohydrate kinase PfkB domain-containing protein n=1 Tax=Lactuca saligna TaxID=75948 RepID=A0AA35ZMT1_LACSI|nr:unnamed protein product [Lactuca saligna]
MDRHSPQKPHWLVKSENQKEEEGEAQAVIIGGMVLDIHAIPSIPPNPRTTAPGKVRYAAGGVARNIAECVSKLGTKPFMISALGSDIAGNMLLEYWKSSGLSTEGIRMGNEIETPVVSIVFDTEGESAAAVASVESLEQFLTPKWIQQFKTNLASAPIVMVDANLSPLALEASCQLAAEVGTPVWFEPVSVAKSRRIVSVAKYITFTSPNEDELIAMANALSPKHTFSPIQKEASTITSLFQQLKPAISILLEKGIKVVILTLGSKGVLLCSKKHFNFLDSICPKRINNNKRLQEAINLVCPVGRFSGGVVHFPAVSLAAVVRLTGAGDCLVGGVVASVCGGLDLMQSVAVGIATAKAAVEVEMNVPLQFDFDHIAEDARSVYLGAKVVFSQSML